MTEIHRVDLADDSRHGWLRPVGIAAIVAAALASILFATPAMPEPPSTGTSCTSDIGGNWAFRNCDEPAGVNAP